MAAQRTGDQIASIGAFGDVDTTARNTVGTRVKGLDASGNTAEFIYLKGVASTIVGSVVTFDHAGLTTLLVADASGPVAIAMAITVASTWGWYGIQGVFPTDVVANSAAAAAGVKNPGRETTDGKVGDGRAAGDEINNFFQRVATTAAAVVNCQIDHPFVNNFTGA
jgi:hypothetical protein